jgi:ATP-dependent protease ClpP protease subunit
MPSNEIYLIGEVGVDITLQSVIDSVSKTDTSKLLEVHIHSVGGSVYEGKAIYNYLKQLPQGCNTYAVGLVASIASVIMLAGKNKYRYSDNNVLIHLPSAVAEGTSVDFKVLASDLEKEEIKLAKIYESETNFTYAEAISLMREDRFMTNEEAVKFGLEIKPYKAVAKFDKEKQTIINTNKNDELMSTLKAKANLVMKAAKDFLGIKNKIVKSADEKELDFYELGEDDVIEVGAKAYYDGMDADGSFIMPDGETYVFVAGELMEILSEDETDTENKDEIIENLTKQLEAMTNKAVELDTQNKANLSIISNYKGKTSQPAPRTDKAPEAKNKDDKKATNASKAMAGFKTLNTIK